MTDPERFSQRSTGLAAELLRAGAEERPNDSGVQRTLLALGLSGVVLSFTGATSAVAMGGAKLTHAVSASASAGGVALANAGTINAVSVTLIIKWIGIGVVGGISLAGVAAVATRPAAPPSPVSRVALLEPQHIAPTAAPTPPKLRSPVVDSPAAPEVALTPVPSAPRVGVLASRIIEPAPDAGIPLASEVAYVDRGRALLAAGQSSSGLALLERYEQTFREPRLLPEVLFLQLEAYERLARDAEARSAAQRLVDGFPKSPHAGRARKLLEQPKQ